MHSSLGDVVGAKWRPFVHDGPPSRAVLQRLVSEANRPWQLVPPSPRERYEDAVAQGRIPTREHSWHDSFNVLAFVSWPHAKAALHTRVRQCQALRTGTARRSREEDALALLDEAVLVIAAPRRLVAAAEAARRTNDFEAMDVAVQSGVTVRWFGHALLEHLALDRPRVDAGVWTVVADDAHTADLALAHAISQGVFAVPCYSPTLPWPHPRVLDWLKTSCARP